MNVKRIIVIGGIGLILIALIAFIFFSKNSDSAPGSGSATTTPVNQATSYGAIPQGNTLSIQTSKGSVTVNNFYNGQGAASDTPAIFVAATSGYSIIYFRSDSSFEIDINDGANTSTQIIAENELLLALGISKVDACKLPASEWLLPSGDDTERLPLGGLSFCTSGTF